MHQRRERLAPGACPSESRPAHQAVSLLEDSALSNIAPAMYRTGVRSGFRSSRSASSAAGEDTSSGRGEAHDGAEPLGWTIRGVGSPVGSRSVAGDGRAAGGMVVRPGLFGRLGGPARVTVVSAPAGSGKTVLLRSWIVEAGLAGRAAGVAAGREERDPQRFWLSVLGALRGTG